MAEEKNPALLKLQSAVQEFVQSTEEHPVLVTTAVLAFERVRLDEDGGGLYRTDYSVITEGSTPASSVGVMVMAHEELSSDLARVRGEDNE